ncbi:MAG TPA: transcriptional regulator [Clostridiales bacterium]|nr:MAG: hypothetical protein A2Y22_07830 [Clostridiales bacterium GWD2_32_59]HAN09157.1 transcriptional regulator [Clostridiales bacterium]
MFQEYIKILSQNALFANISTKELENLIACLNPSLKDYSKNEYVALQGDTAKYLSVILQGSISLIKESYSGNSTLIGTLKQGDIFGEALIFMDKAIYPVSILSIEKTKIMYISKEKIPGQCENTCAHHNNLITNLLGILSKKVLMLNKKVDYLTIKSMRQKLITYILDEYKKAGNLSFTLPHNRNDLSNFLNVSRSSMSRELCRMRDEGIIAINRQHMTIIALDKLIY